VLFAFDMVLYSVQTSKINTVFSETTENNTVLSVEINRILFYSLLSIKCNTGVLLLAFLTRGALSSIIVKQRKSSCNLPRERSSFARAFNFLEFGNSV